MKPISVRFKCFGPYMEEQTVDFEKLSNNGIFLICGETGSGKTTILDAICYALFGKSSGGLRQGIEVMRCKSAKKADKTIVEYIFECNGNRYRFHRELRYGTKNLIEEDGCEILQNDEFVPIFQNPKATVVNKKAEEILGLTYDQFCQVVMLPQGKFERLLVSNSEEKEKILTSLFHADKWNEIVLGVKTKVEEETKRLEKELADIHSQLRVYGCTSVDGLKEKLTALEEELVSLTTAVQEAEHCKQQAAKAYEDSIIDNEFFNALESYRKKLYALKQQTEEYARRQKALQLSEAADAIRGIHEAYSAAKDTADKAEADLRSAVSALSTAEESDRAAKKEKEQHDECRASYDSDKETLMRLKDARDLYASIGEKKKAVEAFAKEEKEKETAAEATKQAYDAARNQWEKAKAENDAAVSAYQEISKGQAPMYYAEGTHPAIIDKEMFEMVRVEMQRRKDEKVTAVGNSKYTSKYPFSGLLICGECGHKLRRHVRRVGSGLMVPAWGCSNRISNGRAACDSHHVNEDTLQNTYTAAIRDMIEDAEEIMTAVKESAGLVMEPENRAALDRIEQEIIDLQNAVLELHKAKQQRSVTAADYAAQIKEYSQRMQELEAQQAELQTTENRYGEVKLWLDSFAEHIQIGAIMNADDSMIMKQLVEQIIVGDDGIEVHFKCGIVASHEYQ